MYVQCMYLIKPTYLVILYSLNGAAPIGLLPIENIFLRKYALNFLSLKKSFRR